MARGCRPKQLRQAVRAQLADRSGVRMESQWRQATPRTAARHRRFHPRTLYRSLRTHLRPQVQRLDQAVKPPEAKRVGARREHHGDVFIDPYEWLRDKSNPEVVDYLKAENDYTEYATEDLAPLRQKIFDEIKARTKETDLSVPTRRDDWWYYGRSFEGKQYSVQCRCPVIDPGDWTPPQLDEETEIPAEQILLDENVEAEGHDFFALGAATVSLDGNILAYSVDVKGDERYTLRFKDLRTGALYEDQIVDIGAGATWAADNHTIYYVTVDDAWRPDTVWRHRLGSGLPAERVYHEPDEKFWLAIGRTRSSKYIIIAAGSAVTTEMRYGDATDGQTEFTTIWPRRELVEYSVEHAVIGGEDRFLILHNDGAENFTLVEAPVSDPNAFRTLIEHRDDVRLDAVDAFAGHIVVSYRSEALPRIQLWPLYAEGTYGRPEDFTFESELTSAGLSANPNWSSPKLRIGATSFVIPVRIYDIDLASGERTLLREQPVLRADAAVRLRRLRIVRRPAVLHRPTVAAGPRHGVRGGARAGRRRTRQTVVR